MLILIRLAYIFFPALVYYLITSGLPFTRP